MGSPNHEFWGGDDKEDIPPPKQLAKAKKKVNALKHLLLVQQLGQEDQPSVVGPLSAVEQEEYLDLLNRYQNQGVFTPTAEEQVEVLRLAELQLRVAAQQREFSQRWPFVPGLRPEVLTDGVASRSQAPGPLCSSGCTVGGIGGVATGTLLVGPQCGGSKCKAAGALQIWGWRIEPAC